MPIRKILLYVTAMILATAVVRAADDPFVGTWKVNTEKSHIAGQVQEIRHLETNKYDWIYGDTHMTLLADGKQHPYMFGGTWSVKQESPDRWIMTHIRNGKVSGIDTWTLSEGGRQWTRVARGTRPDGSPFKITRTYARVGPGSGFIGSWELKNFQANSSGKWFIKPYGNDGLTFSDPAQKESQNIRFDGKDYPDHGPWVAPGNVSSAKRFDGHHIQMTDKLHGKVIRTEQIRVSEDGKTLTDSILPRGEQKPVILVFEKQM